MHGTTKKNSLIVRPGLPDYIIIMRKGKDVDEDRPVVRNIPFDKWCEYAEPVWMDINPSDTVKFRDAKAEKDEKALVYLERLLSLDDSYVAVLTMVGNIYRRKQDFDKAIALVMEMDKDIMNTAPSPATNSRFTISGTIRERQDSPSSSSSSKAITQLWACVPRTGIA